MRALWQAIATLCVLHIVAGLGVVGYLAATDRLSRERVIHTVQSFRPTLEAEQAELQKLEQIEREAMEQAERLLAFQGAGGGPESVAQRLAGERQRHEMTLHQLERTQADVEALRRNLQLAQQRVEQQRRELLEQQAAFDEQVKQTQQRLNDAGFRKTVALFESMPPRQAKDMLVSMLDQDQAEDVVNLLEAMQPRKAAGVLKEFKAAEELTRAVDITQRLRERGSKLAAALENAG